MNSNKKIKFTVSVGEKKPYDAKALEEQLRHKHEVFWRGYRFKALTESQAESMARFLKKVDPHI